MVVALTIDTRTETTWRIDNARSYPTKPPADHSRGTSGPLAHVRVFAGRRAAVDPAATLSLRTGCDATLQSVYPGRSACLSLHVCLPALSQPHLPRRIVRRPEKEAETPLRNPIVGIAGCCARAVSGHAAAPPISVMNPRQFIRSLRRHGRAASAARREGIRGTGVMEYRSAIGPAKV